MTTRPPTGPEIIARMQAHGVTLAAEGGRLRVSAPAGRMTPELRSLLTGNMPTLMAALTGQPVPSGVGGIVWDPKGGVRLTDPGYFTRLAVWNLAKRCGFP